MTRSYVKWLVESKRAVDKTEAKTIHNAITDRIGRDVYYNKIKKDLKK